MFFYDSFESSVDIDQLDKDRLDCDKFSVDHIPDGRLVEESGKLAFLVLLLENIKADGHRCLVFSQSRRMLDIIQKVIKSRVCIFIVFSIASKYNPFVVFSVIFTPFLLRSMNGVILRSYVRSSVLSYICHKMCDYVLRNNSLT